MTGGAPDRWCHVLGEGQVAAEEASAEAIPDLVRIARLAYGDARPALPSNACLAEEPPLQQLARGGIDAR
jgi:hypothetical protein